MSAIRGALAALLLLLPAAAGAIEPVDLSDPEHKRRFDRIAAEMRCLVCQNQAISESNAPLARDMRDVIARMLEEGESDDAIYSFMTERYGDFVLFRPPLDWRTAALWVFPFAVAAAALLLAPRMFRGKGVEIASERRGEARRLLEERE